MFCQNDRNEKLLFYRHTYQYFAALSVTGVNTYTTAEPLDNDTANVKSKPCTGFEIIYFGKPFEYPLLLVGRYAGLFAKGLFVLPVAGLSADGLFIAAFPRWTLQGLTMPTAP